MLQALRRLTIAEYRRKALVHHIVYSCRLILCHVVAPAPDFATSYLVARRISGVSRSQPRIGSRHFGILALHFPHIFNGAVGNTIVKLFIRGLLSKKLENSAKATLSLCPKKFVFDKQK